MEELKYQKRAVAFIDILGFKNLVMSSNNEKNFKELKSLIHLLEEAVPNLDKRVDKTIPKELIPKYLLMSDCIILSAPLTSVKMPQYNGLEIIAMRAIQLTHYFLEKGYLIRGGVSIGDVWHSDRNIVGPAYIEAYNLESNSKEPFIKHSESANQYWHDNTSTDNFMSVTYKDAFIVNGLHDFYIPKKGRENPQKLYREYNEIILDNLNSNLPTEARFKWWLFEEYFKDFMSKNTLLPVG